MTERCFGFGRGQGEEGLLRGRDLQVLVDLKADLVDLLADLADGMEEVLAEVILDPFLEKGMGHFHHQGLLLAPDRSEGLQPDFETLIADPRF
jgi:hypothetical protein